MTHIPTVAGGRGTSVPVRSWQVQSSAVDPAGGEVVSSFGYRPGAWYDAPPRSTVMAALLSTGVFGELSYSTRLRDEVDSSMFEVPWWFRTDFRVGGEAGTRTHVVSEGIIAKADLWVNGERVAGHDVIAGAYTSNAFDVTELVHRGSNVLSYLVHPGSPMTDLAIGWVDWNQWPPDNNMGMWRDVLLARTGPVRLSNPRVTAELSSDHRAARLVITCDVSNHAAKVLTVLVRATVTGPGGNIVLTGEAEVGVPGGESQRFELTREIAEPAVWWPAELGAQPLYGLEMDAIAAGSLSDRTTTSFGIRSMRSEIAPGGGRWFIVNGRRLPIRGAGWAPDLFLRHDPQRIRDQLCYTLDLGLNTIRLEGKGENPEFFEMADELGLLALAGWECCDKWEAHAGTGGTAWDEHDYVVAARSMEAEAYRLANHPCVVGFLIGSDFAPPSRECRGYLDALAKARWDLPIISSATVQGTEEAGPSGMKMTGPYSWVPPAYWYRDEPNLGGAVGFNSETSAGNNLPRLESIERMLSDEEMAQLWQQPTAKQFHAGPPSEFDNLSILHRALSARLGPPRSLRDFVAKAQLHSYEATRAQFEAYASRIHADEPATGLVYWMLNSAWPSLNWQLWDYYLDASAAYFGTKKAHEPVHIQYDYGDHSVVILNRTRLEIDSIVASAVVRSANGAIETSSRQELSGVGPGEIVRARTLSVAPPRELTGAYFLELLLVAQDDGAVLSRNVYWLSTVPDVLDVEQTTWQYTPTSSWADMREFERLCTPGLSVTATVTQHAGSAQTVVVIENVSSPPIPALGVHVSLRAAGRLVAPVFWSDNDVTLFGSQTATLTGRCSSAELGSGSLAVEVEAFNLSVPTTLAVQMP